MSPSSKAHLEKTVAKLCFLVSSFLRFYMDIVDLVGVPICCEEATCSFPSYPDSQNNHTETILFTPLLGPLALASYWLVLTY